MHMLYHEITLFYIQDSLLYSPLKTALQLCFLKGKETHVHHVTVVWLCAEQSLCPSIVHNTLFFLEFNVFVQAGLLYFT